MSSDAKAAVEALELVDGEEDPVTGITAIVPLSDNRRAVYVYMCFYPVFTYHIHFEIIKKVHH